jgi:hypothetical protein
MKQLWENLITSVSASSENENFPADLLLNRSPKIAWVAADGVYSAVLTAETSNGVTDIIIAGTNATSISITGTDPNGVGWAEDDGWAEGVTWVSPEVNVYGETIQRSRSQAMWITLSTVVDIPILLEITLTCDSSETLYAGTIMAGVPDDFGGGGPRYGAQEGRQDLSVKVVNKNGSIYYKKRDILRTFAISALLKEASAAKMMDIYEDIGEQGAGWKLTTENDQNVVVYARHDGPPVKSRDHYSHSNMAINLVEVL